MFAWLQWFPVVFVVLLSVGALWVDRIAARNRLKLKGEG